MIVGGVAWRGRRRDLVWLVLAASGLLLGIWIVRSGVDPMDADALDRRWLLIRAFMAAELVLLALVLRRMSVARDLADALRGGEPDTRR